MTIDTVSICKGVAVVAGPRISFLDHLMPLVHFWNVPLVCTDPWVAACAHLFYPPAEIIVADPYTFQNILSLFETFITVEPCRLHPHALQFGDLLYRGGGKTVAGFHGNPCKFRNEYWIERYVDEDCLLIYGEYLLDYLREKGALHRVKKIVQIGNLRRWYYEKHRPFFDRVAEPHLFPDNGRKTILWAPTWVYPRCPTTLQWLDQIPDPYQIIVKLHPFMYHLYPEQIALWKEQYKNLENILILDEIPLIYPLIERADFYLGDYSSVAYDFLYRDRPLFLAGDLQVPWATSIKEKSDLFAALDAEDTLSEMRKKTYTYVYGSSDWNFTR